MFSKFLFLSVLFISVSDEWAFHNYNSEKANDVLQKHIFRNRFWMQPADDHGNPFFVTKRDFKEGGRLRIVPVLKLSKVFKDYKYDQDLRKYFEPDYSQYCALIYKANKFLDVMFVTYGYSDNNNLASVASLGDRPASISDILMQNDTCLFYDGIIHSFCYFKDDTLYAWSHSKGQFITYREMIEDEKFGLDVFKESIKGR